jgi:hypothetical protein
MLAQFPLNLSFEHSQAWVTPLVGLAFTGVTLLVGRAVLHARRQSALAAQDSQKLLDPFDFGSASERRASARRTGKLLKVLISSVNGNPEALEGCILDRSMGGLCVALPRPVNLDAVLSVRAADASESTPWVEVSVRRCAAKDDQWEVGCQFVRTPPWGVLLQFG